jgi:predicted component of type VI protein secretion system
MQRTELEILKRSAAMAPLAPDHVDRLIRELERLLEERDQLRAIVDGLGPSFGDVRTSLNEIAKMLR